MDSQWHIMCALNDSDLFDEISHCDSLELCLDNNIDPAGITAEELIEIAENADANLVIMTVDTYRRETDVDAFTAAEARGEMNFIMIYDEEASAITTATYRERWKDAALSASMRNEKLVQAIVEYCKGEDEPYDAEDADEYEGGAEQEDAEYYEAAADPERSEDTRTDEESDAEEEDGGEDEDGEYEDETFLTRIIAPFTDEDGRINKTGILAIIAVALLLVFILIPKGNKKKEDVPAEPLVVSESPTQDNADSQAAYEDPAFIEDHGEYETDPEPTPAFEPINLAQQGYDAIMATLASVDLASLEMAEFSTFRAGVIGCAAGYDKDNNAVAVAAYKIENTGSQPIIFMEDMYGHGEQNGQTLTVDTAYLQGEALGTANKSIEAGQTLIIYQAYRLNTSKDDVTACIESWDVDEPVQAKTYRLAQ